MMTYMYKNAYRSTRNSSVYTYVYTCMLPNNTRPGKQDRQTYGRTYTCTRALLLLFLVRRTRRTSSLGRINGSEICRGYVCNEGPTGHSNLRLSLSFSLLPRALFRSVFLWLYLWSSFHLYISFSFTLNLSILARVASETGKAVRPLWPCPHLSLRIYAFHRARRRELSHSRSFAFSLFLSWPALARHKRDDRRVLCVEAREPPAPTSNAYIHIGSTGSGEKAKSLRAPKLPRLYPCFLFFIPLLFLLFLL